MPWYPLEFADQEPRWSHLGRSGADPDEGFVKAALSAVDQDSFHKLMTDNPDGNIHKLFFHQLASAESKRQMDCIVKYMGHDAVAAILDADAVGMTLTLSFLLGMRCANYYFSESNGSTYGFRWLEMQRPGLVASARDRFGNTAQHYLLAGYGSLVAPCYSGAHDVFCWEHTEDVRNMLNGLGCSAAAKNGFGFSVSGMMSRSEAPMEDD